MAGMNINQMRNVVIAGNVATITGQIIGWQIYGERTGEDVSVIVVALTAQLAALTAMLSSRKGAPILPLGGQGKDILAYDDILGAYWKKPQDVATDLPLATPSQKGMVKHDVVNRTITGLDGAITIALDAIDYSDGLAHYIGSRWIDGKKIFGQAYSNSDAESIVAQGVDSLIGSYCSVDVESSPNLYDQIDGPLFGHGTNDARLSVQNNLLILKTLLPHKIKGIAFFTMV